MKKNLYRAALLAAFGLAGSTAAQAQIQANVDDLMLGFTSPNAPSVGGTQYDYIVDIGNLSDYSAPQQISLSNPNPDGGGATLAYNNTVFDTDMASAVAGGNAYVGVWGGSVIGGPNSGGDVFLSATSQPVHPTVANVNNAIGSAYAVNDGAVAQGNGASVFQAIAETPNSGGHPAGASVGSFGSYAGSPLETISSAVGTGTGTETLTLWDTYENGAGTTTTAYSDIGYISIAFGANGDVDALAWDETATTSVPEPATYGIFGSIGVLLLALRRQFTGSLV